MGVTKEKNVIVECITKIVKTVLYMVGFMLGVQKW